MTKREQLIAVARSYMDTPYEDHGRTPHVALDCVGLLVCAAREAGLVAPGFDVPEYLAKPDGTSLMKWAVQFLGPSIPRVTMRAGDVIVVKPGKRPQHLGLLGDYLHDRTKLSLIHASNAASPARVVESRLMFSSAMFFVAVFTIPGIDDG